MFMFVWLYPLLGVGVIFLFWKSRELILKHMPYIEERRAFVRSIVPVFFALAIIQVITISMLYTWIIQTSEGMNRFFNVSNSKLQNCTNHDGYLGSYFGNTDSRMRPIVVNASTR